MICDYKDFVKELLAVGFTIGGENNEGVFALADSFDGLIRWHTEEKETDPWEWRMRVLEERSDIAYGKVFFRKSGYITKAWYPYFLAVRRQGKSFEELYDAGKMSHHAKVVYRVIAENGYVPTHALRGLCGFGAEDKSKLDRAVTELQMKLFITMCGRQQKVSQTGQEFGWNSTVFCTAETFWGSGVFAEAAGIAAEEAAEKIRMQVYAQNPDALEKKVKKFIWG